MKFKSFIRNSKNEEKIKKSILYTLKNSNFQKSKIELSSFTKNILKLINNFTPIKQSIVNLIIKNNVFCNMIINTKREKYYTVNLSNLKCLFRIDTIYLIQTFFMEGFPYYDYTLKDLPNLFDSNEDNLVDLIVCLMKQEIS